MADSIAEVDKNIKKVQAKLISRAEAIAKMDGITVEEAYDKLKAIEKEANEFGFDESQDPENKDTNKVKEA